MGQNGFFGANWRSVDPWAQPVIQITIEAENPENTDITGIFFEGMLPMDRSEILWFISVNSTLSVKVKTSERLLDNYTDEHVAQLNNTKQFATVLDGNQFKVGPETNRAILINIYNFTAPLKIKVMFPKVILTRGIFTAKPLAMNFFRWPSRNSLVEVYGLVSSTSTFGIPF